MHCLKNNFSIFDHFKQNQDYEEKIQTIETTTYTLTNIKHVSLSRMWMKSTHILRFTDALNFQQTTKLCKLLILLGQKRKLLL